MAVQQATMHDLGRKVSDFSLPIANPWIDDFDAPTRSMSMYPDARVYAVVFTCNHCPYAVHIQHALVDTARAYAEKGVQFIAINSNDPVQYPEDGFEAMAERAREIGMTFPYLFDETQDVARDYGAVCTPDFFVCDYDRVLFYRGRFDDTRPGQGKAHGGELKAALDAFLDRGQVLSPQYPSMGCSIKWKPGNAP